MLSFIQGLTEDYRQEDSLSVALRNFSEEIGREASLYMILAREYVQSSIHLSKKVSHKDQLSVLFYVWKNARIWVN